MDIEIVIPFVKNLLNKNIEVIPFEQTLKEANARHCAHCCIWGPADKPSVGIDKNTLEKRATVLMHLRFDGTFGYHGGTIDESLDNLPVKEAELKVVQGLNRELEEELNYDTVKHRIEFKDYLFSSKGIHKGRIYIYHFFTYKVNSCEDIVEIERRSIDSKEHGRENLGNIRVPLYTMSNNRGFPDFLGQRMIDRGENFFVFLLCKQIMTMEEIEHAYRHTHAKKKRQQEK